MEIVFWNAESFLPRCYAMEENYFVADFRDIFFFYGNLMSFARERKAVESKFKTIETVSRRKESLKKQ